MAGSHIVTGGMSEELKQEQKTKLATMPKATVVNLNTTPLWRSVIGFFSKIFKKKETVAEVEVEKTAEEIKIEKESHRLLGDGYLKKGSPEKALNAYLDVKIDIPIDKFNECGNFCLKKGKNAHSTNIEWLINAKISFFATKNKAKLIECGELMLSHDNFTEKDALECFVLAAEIPD